MVAALNYLIKLIHLNNIDYLSSYKSSGSGNKPMKNGKKPPKVILKFLKIQIFSMINKYDYKQS